MFFKLSKKALPALALLLAITLLLSGCSFKKGRGGAEQPVSTPEATEASSEEEHAAETMREVTLYYVSDEGYVVPVKKLVPWEEGIAKACLGYITSSAVNDRAAAVLGLNTVLPRGAEVSLVIQNGEAKADLKNLSPLDSAEAERAMLTAVVNTLAEFATVECVTVTRDGMGGRLENGSELPVRQEAYKLNIEQTELSASAGAAAGTLYFPNLSGALTVPVTRYFASGPSLYTVAAALVKGPATEDLMCCFPSGTLLLGATLENGVVTVNLSEDFKQVEQTYGMYSLAYKTLLLTLKQEFDFTKLVIQVNGSVYAPELAAG